MTEHSTESDTEFAAMHAVFTALSPLDEDGRRRVIAYITSRLGITAKLPFRENTAVDQDASGGEADTDPAPEKASTPTFDSFAELYDAAQPGTPAEKALTAGYWLQVVQGASSFDGFSAHKELKNLGQGLTNITDATESLQRQKPALALQLKKSGKTKQARKTYKLTVAGIKAIEAKING